MLNSCVVDVEQRHLHIASMDQASVVRHAALGAHTTRLAPRLLDSCVADVGKKRLHIASMGQASAVKYAALGAHTTRPKKRLMRKIVAIGGRFEREQPAMMSQLFIKLWRLTGSMPQ